MAPSGGGARVIRNEEVAEVIAAVPEGHRHLRTTLRLASGEEMIFQEATVAALVRAYVAVKTHPSKTSMRLEGRPVADRKPGYARWQLVEEVVAEESGGRGIQ